MKSIFTVLIFFISPFFFCQIGVVKTIPFHHDRKIIDSLKLNLEKSKVDTFFYLITQFNNNDLTYFFWIEKGQTNVILIEDSIISKMSNISFHFPKNIKLKNLAIRNSENNLKFRPPIVHNSECDFFIFEANKRKLLISNGKCLEFSLKKSKMELRSKFFKEIITQLPSYSNLKWNKISNYQRFNE